VYEQRMAAFIDAARRGGVKAVAFGDLFLADIRAYREAMLRGSGIEPLFPLWGRDTGQLADEMISNGLCARVVCVDPRQAPRDILGQNFDGGLLSRLPPAVDP